MPDLRQLRAFVAVAEERNFTRAAERLNLAQQAVSRTVAQLEAELGVALLERTTREVRLTPAGASLLADGRELLTKADAAFARAAEVGRGEVGVLRVGLSPAVGAAVAREVAVALRAGHEELSVSVHDVRPGELTRRLRDRELDLAVVRTLRGDPEVDSAPLRPTPAVLAVPAGHRLADAGPVALAELDGERLLVASGPGSPYTAMLLNRLAGAGARVEAVEQRVLGAMAPGIELREHGAVALLPAGWPPDPAIVAVALREPVLLPLIVAWATGTVPAAVERLRAALG